MVVRHLLQYTLVLTPTSRLALVLALVLALFPSPTP